MFEFEYHKTVKNPYAALKRLEQKLGFEVTYYLDFDKNLVFRTNEEDENYRLIIDYNPHLYEEFLYVYYRIID